MCEWCGRPFLLRDQRRPGRWLWPVALGACLAVGALVIVASLVSWLGVVPRPGGASPSATAPAVPTPEPAPPPAAPALPAPEPTSEPPEFVRVVNTAGQGVILRREPSTRAPRVAARAENTILQVVGPDTTAEGRVWRQVQDAQGNRGWVPADFLAPAPAPPGA